jgi:hypothetical protein
MRSVAAAGPQRCGCARGPAAAVRARSSVGPAPAATPRARLSSRAAGGRPIEGGVGAERGPGRPGPSGRPQPAAQPGPELGIDDELLLVQSAIGKQYRAKLLEFRAAMTPEALDALRARLPPEHAAGLEEIIAEARALDGGDEPPLTAAEATSAWAARKRELLAGGGAGAGGLELTPAEQAAWDALQEETLPDDFLRWGFEGLGASVGAGAWRRRDAGRGGEGHCGGSGGAPSARPAASPCGAPPPPRPRAAPTRSYLSLMLPEDMEEGAVVRLMEGLPRHVTDELQARGLGAREDARWDPSAGCGQGTGGAPIQ